MSAPKCPYCGSTSVLKKDSSVIYRKNYGPVYLCANYPSCDAYVGCHPRTTTPLGRLADRELRAAKKNAHAHFDPLWQAKIQLGASKKDARTAGYAWLAERMCMSPDRCHIGMFNVEECERVVRICSPFLRKLGLTEEVKREGPTSGFTTRRSQA